MDQQEYDETWMGTTLKSLEEPINNIFHEVAGLILGKLTDVPQERKASFLNSMLLKVFLDGAATTLAKVEDVNSEEALQASMKHLLRSTIQIREILRS